jgi:other hect domain ubiquitin protein ligase E3
LKSQPPQIEQNKLLKYWEKSILPKIYEFVKTTLKPIEIEDFWEQMRRPLRVNDHTEAKRVAYIICDNKLPNGAVIPDTNHNWNSLEIE